MIPRPITSRVGAREIRSARTVCAIVLSCLLCARCPLGLGDDRLAAGHNGERPQRREETPKPRVKVAVSKETTRILEPLDDEGFVDYLAAVNRMALHWGVVALRLLDQPLSAVFGGNERCGRRRTELSIPTAGRRRPAANSPREKRRQAAMMRITCVVSHVVSLPLL
jgi:hypothetical protein